LTHPQQYGRPHGGQDRYSAPQYAAPQYAPPPQQYPPTGHGPAIPEPPKKKRKWPWIVGGVVGVIVLAAAVNGGGTSGRPDPATAAAQQPGPTEPAAPAGAAEPDLDFGEKLVTLTVEGSGKATVTYMKSGGQEQKEVTLPWTSEIKASFISSLVAQKKSGNSAEISCRIAEGSEVIADNTSSGPYAVVTCSG
jgi:hypothetical protein